MFSRFFIDRPLFATVISTFLVIAGLAAMRALPIAQYPEIAPPVVTVQAVYPGASAKTLEQTVASPLENAINGVPGMIYMSSSSSAAGTVQIQVTFEIGTNVDIAAVNVNNRVKQVEPRLPEEVRRQGVTVERGSSAFLQVLAFYAPDGRYDDLFTSNYVTLNVLDHLKRLPGTTNVQIFGAKDYAMRIWLKPERLAQLKLTPNDVIAAVNEQNAQFAAGKIGQSPIAKNQDLVYTVTTRGRLSDPKQFEQIIVRANPDGVDGAARRRRSRRTGLEGLRVHGPLQRQAGDAGRHLSLAGRQRARSRQDASKTEMAVLSQRFPEGLSFAIPYDTTRFVGVSIGEVLKTLGEAMLLVFLVVYPVPAELARGDHPVRRGAGVADRHLRRHLPARLLDQHADAVRHGAGDRHRRRRRDRRARERRAHHARGRPDARATRRSRPCARSPVPIIAIVLTLTAVFVPIAFLGGLTGELYRQFAVTISISVVISGMVALTLSPALCAMMLQAARAAEPVFRGVQPLVQPRHRALHRWRRAGCSGAASSGRCCSWAWSRLTIGLVAHHAGQPGARRGSGLLHQRRHPARRRDARTHLQGRRAGRGRHPLQPQQPGHHLLHRLRFHRRRLPQQRRDASSSPRSRGTSAR